MPRKAPATQPKLVQKKDPKTYYLRIAEILELGEHHRGAVAEIAKITKLSPYHVRKLLDGTDSIKLSVLTALSDYLVKKRVLNREDVPGALFGRAPDSFYNSLGRTQRLDLIMGKRKDPHFDDEVVIAADASLQANILLRLTNAAPSAAQEQSSSLQDTERSKLPNRQTIAPSTILTWGKQTDVGSKDAKHAEIQKAARKLYDQICEEKPSRAVVAFGSIKSNPLIELLMVNCFKNARAFASEDNIAQPKMRSCPFLFAYRQKDPKPTSCCGGLQLAQGQKASGPGIYYEDSEGNWVLAPWTDKNDRCALVMYRWQKSYSVMEVVLGGYSSRCTQQLANFLRDDPIERFWPAQYEDDEVAIGVFVLKFSGKDGKIPDTPEIVEISKAALKHRVVQRMPSKSRSPSARKKPADDHT